MSPIKKINKLTPEQIAKFPEYVDKWTKIGLCTEPANRIEAEKYINESYISVGLNPPKKIVWCGSPLSQALVRAIILDKKLIENIGDSVWDSVVDSVRAYVGASVWDSVGDSVRAYVGASVWDSVRAYVWDSGYGQHDANWLAFYDFFRNECGLIKETEKLNALTELSKYTGWFLPHEHICWVSERHCILNRDDNGRLHSLTSAAVVYPDGWKIYAVHGVRLPAWIIEEPEKITIDAIEKEENVEIRRVMTDKYGLDKYLENCGASIIHQDSNGILYKKELSNDEPIVMVKVINSTPEPDGSSKNYFLRVSPDITNATAAIAWTFGMNQEEYKPVIET